MFSYNYSIPSADFQCNNINKETTPQDDKFLHDVRPNGKENEWDAKKQANLELADIVRMTHMHNNYKRADNLEKCGRFLWFNEDEQGNSKLAFARFCKYRLCPTCIWRKSLKLYHQMEQIFSNLDKKSYKWAFLTLTVKNCYGDELKQAIDDLLKGYDRLMKRRNVKPLVVGYYRAIEVTYNRKMNTFHPHIHVLLQLTSSYGNGQYYIKQTEWQQMWAECMNIDYKPVIDIRTVKPRRNKETGEQDNMIEAICECTKYPVKDADYIQNDGTVEQVDTNAYVVETLDRALHGRKLVYFGGMLADIKKQLKLEDVESGDLVATDDMNDEKILPVIQKCYAFNMGYMRYVEIGKIPYYEQQQIRLAEQGKVECDYINGNQ